MSDSKLGSRKRIRRRPLQFSAVSGAVLVPAVPLPPLDWSAILESLPQEPPKSVVDLGWNIYKKELWAKYKPDSLVGFELFRMAARSSDMPEGVKFVADFLALLCVVDGYGATVDSLRSSQKGEVAVRLLPDSSLPRPTLNSG